MGDWKEQRKIVALPLPKCDTPEVVLARTLEKARAGHIRSVAICIVWEEGGVDTDFSNGKLSELAFSIKALDMDLQDMMRENTEPGSPDGPAEPPAS